MDRVPRRLFLPLLALPCSLAACATGEAPERASNGSVDPDASFEDAADEAADASDSSDVADSEPGQDALPPCDGNLAINEVQTAGASSTEDEFVELYNPADCVLAVDGYALYYRSGAGTDEHLVWSSVPGQTMQPGQFFTLGGKDFTGGADFPMGAAISLEEFGGALGLELEQVLVDSVGWGNATNDYVEGSPAIAPPAGRSLGRFPDGQDTNDNAEDFTELAPSPRKTNNAW